MKKYIALLFIFLIILIDCATSPLGRKRVLLVKDDEINQMGIKSFAEMKQKTPIEKDPSINRYVKCIANSVLGVIHDDTGVQSWEIVVFKDDTANAFALPGGKIGVHTGILPIAKTKGQLAAVIGHEVGHVIARHGAERISDQMIEEKGIAVIGSVTESKTVAGALGLGAQYGFMLPFSRKHESEADLLGLEYMSEAGFNPEESIKLWQNMEAAGGSGTPEILSTHPSGETRIQNLKDHMDESLKKYKQAQANGKIPNCSL
ncbi:MAG: M48 family metallopeptidase [Leptospiraceae bacterium]|nr:M48 family metallopeptidase [Leptospiraceae bacterium]